MEKNPQNDLVYPGERVDDLQNGLQISDRMKRFWIWEPERESFLFC